MRLVLGVPKEAGNGVRVVAGSWRGKDRNKRSRFSHLPNSYVLPMVKPKKRQAGKGVGEMQFAESLITV